MQLVHLSFLHVSWLILILPESLQVIHLLWGWQVPLIITFLEQISVIFNNLNTHHSIIAVTACCNGCITVSGVTSLVTSSSTLFIVGICWTWHGICARDWDILSPFLTYFKLLAFAGIIWKIITNYFIDCSIW